MIGSPGAVLTLGLGAFVGDSNHLVTFGYGNGAAAVVVPPPAVVTGGAGGLITFIAWKSPSEAEVEKVRLELRLRKEREKLKKIEKKIATVEKKVSIREVPHGVLANLGSLRERAAELRKDIEITAVDLIAIKDFIGSLNFDEDEDDIEELLLSGF
jgi:pyruvate/oxaloacetate carboxyltransferase